MLHPREQGIANRGYGLFVTSIVMVVLAGIFVGARMAYRLSTKRAGWDDWTIVASLSLSVVLTVMMCTSIVHGYGQHKRNLTALQYKQALYYYYFAQVVYKPIIGLTKTSILFSYLRIFTTSEPFTAVTWTIIAVIVSWTIGSTVATVLQCIPITAAWDKNVKNPVCTNSDVFWLAYGGINIATDLIILALPIQPILKLNMKLREKFGLLLAFLLGGFVVLTSILRVVAVSASTQNKADTPWAFVPRATWTLIETNIAIVCACLPALRKPLLSLVSGTHTVFYGSNESQEHSLGQHKALSSNPMLSSAMSSSHIMSGTSQRGKPIMVTKEYEVHELKDRDEEWQRPRISSPRPISRDPFQCVGDRVARQATV